MFACILKFDNKTFTQLHKLLRIKCHLRAKALEGDPSDLDVLFVDISSDLLVQILCRGKEVTWHI